MSRGQGQLRETSRSIDTFRLKEQTAAGVFRESPQSDNEWSALPIRTDAVVNDGRCVLASRRRNRADFCNPKSKLEAIRKSLDVDTWERAEEIKRQIESGDEPEKAETIVSVEFAIDAFVADGVARNLNRNTIAKYKLLAGRLKDYVKAEAIKDIRLFTNAHATARYPAVGSEGSALYAKLLFPFPPAMPMPGAL